MGEFHFHARRKGGDLRGIGGVALNNVEPRVLRLHLIERRLAPPSYDDFVAEFQKLEGKGKADPGGASGYKDGATGEIHRIPFVTTVSGNAFDFWRA